MAKKSDPEPPKDYVDYGEAGKVDRAGASSAGSRSRTASVVESTKDFLRKAARFNVLSEKDAEREINKIEDKSRRRQPIRDRYYRMIDVMNSEGISYTAASERVAEEIVNEVAGEELNWVAVETNNRKREAIARQLRREWEKRHPK